MNATKHKISYFSENVTPFPQVVDDRLKTTAFLASAKTVVEMIDSFGKMFGLVKNDMNGNIEKLTAKYNEDPNRFEYLNDMVLFEKENRQMVATDALLWLRRALHFLLEIFQSILEDHTKKIKNHNIGVAIKNSYAKTLKKHHGWLTQQLFQLFTNMSPSKDTFLDVLTMGDANNTNEAYKDMAIFNDRLRKCVFHLAEFYCKNGLENEPHDVEQVVDEFMALD